jgi:hypothetical protein
LTCDTFSRSRPKQPSQPHDQREKGREKGVRNLFDLTKNGRETALAAQPIHGAPLHAAIFLENLMHWQLITVALIVTTSGTARAGDTLKEYTWEKGKISILLPGMPEEKAQKGTDAGGKAQDTMLWLTVKGNSVYLVSYTIVEALANATDEVKYQSLEKGRDSGIMAVKGKLVSEKKIKLGNNVGLEFQADASFGVYRARLYVIGDRLYQVVIAGPGDTATSKDAEKIFDSFKLQK